MPPSRPTPVFPYLGKTIEQIDNELTAFMSDAALLSKDHENWLSEHSKQWVGVYAGRVAATAKNLDDLFKELERKNVPANQAIVRFIDSEDKEAFGRWR